MTTCPHCSAEFSPRRTDQVYCTPKCRMDHYKAALGDGGLRGTITAVRRLKGGGVSVTTRMPPESAQNALRLIPGQTVEVVGS
mgnify:FL=1